MSNPTLGKKSLAKTPTPPPPDPEVEEPEVPAYDPCSSLFCCDEAPQNGCEEFCATCQLPLCSECKRAAFHAHHNHVSLDVGWKGMQRELGLGRERIKPVIEARRSLRTGEHVSWNIQMKSFLESERVAAHKVILHRFAEWHAMLDRRQAELLAQLDDYADFERQRMENQVEEYQSQLTPMEWELLRVEEEDLSLQDAQDERRRLAEAQRANPQSTQPQHASVVSVPHHLPQSFASSLAPNANPNRSASPLPLAVSSARSHVSTSSALYAGIDTIAESEAEQTAAWSSRSHDSISREVLISAGQAEASSSASSPTKPAASVGPSPTPSAQSVAASVRAPSRTGVVAHHGINSSSKAPSPAPSTSASTATASAASGSNAGSVRATPSLTSAPSTSATATVSSLPAKASLVRSAAPSPAPSTTSHASSHSFLPTASTFSSSHAPTPAPMTSSSSPHSSVSPSPVPAPRPAASGPAPELFAPPNKFDHNAPWWFRLANILLGRRRLRAQRKSWEPEPIPPPPALAICFVRAVAPPLQEMGEFGEVYLSSTCVPLTQVTSALLSSDYHCMHDDAVEVTLKTHTPSGQPCTRGGARWKVDIAEHKKVDLLFKYQFVKELPPKLELIDLDHGEYKIRFKAAFGSWRLTMQCEHFSLPPIDFLVDFENGRHVRCLGREGIDTGELYEPFGLALDLQRQLLIVADKGNNRCQIWNTLDGSARLMIDSFQLSRHIPKPKSINDPPPPQIILSEPHAVALDDACQRLFIADTFNHRVLVVALPEGDYLFEFGSKGDQMGQFLYPGGVCYYQGQLFVSDSNHRVQIFDATDGRFLRCIGSRGDGMGRFNCPFYMTAWDGKLYVGEYYNHRVSVFDLETYGLLWSLGREGSGQREFRRVTGLAIDPKTELIYVGDSCNHRVSVFSADDGSWFGCIGGNGEGKATGQFHHVRDIAIDSQAGLVYVSDWGNHRVQVFGAFQRPQLPADVRPSSSDGHDDEEAQDSLSRPMSAMSVASVASVRVTATPPPNAPVIPPLGSAGSCPFQPSVSGTSAHASRSNSNRFS